MSEKIIYAMYGDDEVLKSSAKKLVSNGVKIAEVYSPFPIHGIDPIIGVKGTRLGIMAFLYGLTGLTLATIGISVTSKIFWHSFRFHSNSPCCVRHTEWRLPICF
jgi:hypothetical protein